MEEYVNLELLRWSSLFLKVATPEDIEHERQAMEAEYDKNLEVWRVNYETRSGAKVTRVEWRVV